MMRKEALRKGMSFMTKDGCLGVVGFNGTHLTVFYEELLENGEVDYGYKYMTISDLERAIYAYSGEVKHFVYKEDVEC